MKAEIRETVYAYKSGDGNSDNKRKKRDWDFSNMNNDLPF